MRNQTHTIADYRRRALELRMIAERIQDHECRDNLLGMAGDYDRLAASLEARRRPTQPNSQTIH